MNVVQLVPGTINKRMTTREITRREREPESGGIVMNVGSNDQIYISTLSNNVSKWPRRRSMHRSEARRFGVLKVRRQGTALLSFHPTPSGQFPGLRMGHDWVDPAFQTTRQKLKG